VRMGAEGGSITLVGQKNSRGGWRYARAVTDHTLTLLDEPDGGGSTSNSMTPWVKTWSEAVALLDRYPWALLPSIEVHPEFAERLWGEVTRRIKDRGGAQAARVSERWARACGVSHSDKDK
jgi:hypothetical protein